MPSQVIRGFRYNPETLALHVTFTTGRCYIYRDVPAEAAERFRAAFSKGRHFNRYIRDAYSFEELDPEPD